MLARTARAARLPARALRPLRARLSSTAGRPIECKAAVSWEAGAPFSVETITVAPPQAGEVRVRMVRSGVCHTDAFTASGADPEGLFPAVLGHEGAGYVESVGEGVESVREGDFVIPLYIPECGTCRFCTSGKTNLCVTLRATQGKGLMPDGTSRLAAADGTALHHYMGISSFAHYSTLPEIAVAKVNPDADPEHAALLGCGVTTGIGAVTRTLKVEPGSSVAVFGLGGVGLAAIQGAAMSGASRVIAVDINPAKEALAREMGATDFLNPKEHQGRPVQEVIVEMTDGGVDYSVEAVGNVDLMRSALECTVRGWGQSCIIGVAGAGQEISTRPFQLVTGRVWRGTAFGGVKGRTELPGMVEQAMRNEIKVAPFVTHRLPLEEINEAFRLMHDGESIRTVLTFD